MPVSTPTVDVVIPVFNGERYLGEAIESVLAQDYKMASIIVVDDGSSDRSVDVARRFPGVVVLRQERRGPAAARNRGVESSSAELLAFLDADDRWLPGKLRMQVEAIMTDDVVDMVFGGMNHFYSPELTPEEYPARPEGQEKGYVIGTMLIRRRSFLRTGLLPTGLAVGEFIAWYAKARTYGLGEAVIHETVLERRLHASNYTRSQRDLRQAYLRVMREKLRAERKE
jgi:glycosyltransferase involved in cell wall biosynthesis